ncbi:MAG TPA: NUDIX domain-containing protein [Verrucomicrobiae bacterium]|nr:NUDIX domain-containing protein [Verrucomicrobiae bacterium]
MSGRHDGVETPYTAVYLIFKKDGKIAFLLRSNTGWMNGHYSLVAGRVDKGEPFTRSAIREAYEEAGATIQPQDLKPVLIIHRNEPGSVWVDLVFEVLKWGGELYNAEPEKHGELVWFDPNQLPENMVPSARFYIEQYLAGSSYAEYGWNK